MRATQQSRWDGRRLEKEDSKRNFAKERPTFRNAKGLQCEGNVWTKNASPKRGDKMHLHLQKVHIREVALVEGVRPGRFNF